MKLETAQRFIIILLLIWIVCYINYYGLVIKEGLSNPPRIETPVSYEIQMNQGSKLSLIEKIRKLPEGE